MRSFHGLVSFYRKFIKNFSGICAPLTDTISGGRKEFKWTAAATRSFELLKKVTEQSVLALLDFNKVFQVDCVATRIAIGLY